MTQSISPQLVSADHRALPFIKRPTLNLTVRFAGTGTRSSVLGFCAIRGAALANLKNAEVTELHPVPFS